MQANRKSKAARPALALTSPNLSRKRAIDDASDASGPTTSKRVSTGPSAITRDPAPPSLAQPKPAPKTRPIEKQPDWAFNVVGTWEIDATHITRAFRNKYVPESEQPPVQPFTLEIRYDNNSYRWRTGRQLWATFKWEKWTGCMRMCPGHQYRFSHNEFYAECQLESGVWPGEAPQGTPVWNFRWKAQIEGWGIVDGTDEWETQLQFKKNEDGTLGLDGKMLIGGCKVRKFSGVKISEDLPELEKPLDHIMAVWKKLSAPDEESRHEICRGCKGKMDDSDESESEPPSEHDWEAERKEREAELAREKAEMEAPWPTPMTGTWAITPRNNHRHMDYNQPDAERFMHIQETCRADGSGRQYWATFQFGREWSGIMRLCPKPAVKEKWESGAGLSVKDFEKACVLEEGVNPGPPPHGVNEWLIKWRGPLDLPSESVARRAENTEVTDELTSDLVVKKGKDGALTLSGAMQKGCIGWFKGVRTGDFDPTQDGPALEKLWKQRALKSPPKPIHLEWHSALPDDPIQNPPKWAWDVLGLWKVSAPGFAEAFGNHHDAQMILEIKMDNSRPNAKASLGRQLWAQFYFFDDDDPGAKSTGGIGCMRFCPLPENSRPCDDVEEFEKACKLKSGVWPGDVRSSMGKSFQKWGCRWRGYTQEGDDVPTLPWTDRYETRIDFKLDDDGKLSIGGLLALNCRYIIMRGTKTHHLKAPDHAKAALEDDTAVSFWKMMEN